MDRKYDLVERLKAKNERPFLVLDEQHVYSINTSKTNALAIMALMDKRKSENATDLSMIDDVIRMSLGEDALLYLNAQEISIAALQEIVKTIMAAMADMSLEESEQQAKKINDRVWYDLFEDWELIEAFFAMQYPGKDLYDDTMDWKEFITLLAGHAKETPLGQIIAIRRGRPADLKQFSAEQQKSVTHTMADILHGTVSKERLGEGD